MDARTSLGSRKGWLLGLVALLVMLAGAAGWYAARYGSDPAAALSSADRKAIEAVVREYILANPEILPEAMENLQHKENAKQLAGIKGDVEQPYPGAVMGNPRGTVTLVEFSDFACGFCRQSVADVKTLIAKTPELRVVMRELPILSEHSTEAAKIALAAAEQGKYEAFHDAMFAIGKPAPDTIEAAARQAGLDLKKARAAAASPRVQEEIDRNMALARQLGFNGTPSWVAGDRLISGAVGADELARAIEAARN